MGTRQSRDSSIKAGVDIVRKSVVHINNLDANCAVALLTDYLFANDISVLSCHATKSWLCIDEKHRVTAFRVCVGLNRAECRKCGKIMDTKFIVEWYCNLRLKIQTKHHPGHSGQ